MLVRLAKCPHCGGKFDPGSDICIYCGYGLIYEGEVKKKSGISRGPERLEKEGKLLFLAHERSYYGCPTCLKRVYNGYNLCNHNKHSVELFWRKYVARDSKFEKFVIECIPLVKRLISGGEYKFYGTFYPENDRFVVNKIEELES